MVLSLFKHFVNQNPYKIYHFILFWISDFRKAIIKKKCATAILYFLEIIDLNIRKKLVVWVNLPI